SSSSVFPTSSGGGSPSSSTSHSYNPTLRFPVTIFLLRRFGRTTGGDMYDAIVIGARCAGAVTAMLLARHGYRVLLLERGVIPSDVHQGHFIHRHGPKRLADWGLLERIVGTNCPPLTTHLTDFGDFPLVGRDIQQGNVAWGYAPRRRQLDQVLVEAAI